MNYKVLITFLLFGGLVLRASAATFVVPGTSDPWLAGMPSGSFDNLGTPEPPDVAPAQSPVFAGAVSGGSTLTWTAAGVVGHPGEPAGPDGETAVVLAHLVGANNGMSDITSPVNALLGVFLGPDRPDLNPAPSSLDFSTQASRDYTTLAPALQQVFFMGDGLTSGSLQQEIIAPAGATRLFLGTMDGWGWANNVGDFRVAVEGAAGVPDSAQSLSLLLIGMAALGTLKHRFALQRA